MADHTAPGRGPPNRAGPEDSAIPRQGCKSSSKRSDHNEQASPWAKRNSEQAAEIERLRALHAEAWQHDSRHGAFATRAVSILDLSGIFAAGRFGLLSLLCDWTNSLPATCRKCGTRLNEPDDIGGFAVTTAAHAPKPRFAIVSGFCHACAVHSHETMRLIAARALQREGIVDEIIADHVRRP